MAFTNVNIGHAITGVNKRATFDKSCNSSFSASFGRVIPSYTDKIIGKSTINVNGVSTVMRMNPLAVPTFGDIRIKHYHTFIPIHTLFDPYESFQTNNRYHFYDALTIPASAPSIGMHIMCQQLSRYIQNSMPNYMETDGIKYTGTHVAIYKGTTLVSSAATAQSVLNALFTFLESRSLPLPVYFDSYSSFRYTNKFTNLSLTNIYKTVGSVSTTLDVVYEASPSSFDVSRTISLSVDGATAEYTFYIRWGNLDRRLHEILIGLTYPSSILYKEINLLPMFAFYKAWFDLFAIQKHLNWQDTACNTMIQINRTYSVFNNYYADPNTASAGQFFYELLTHTCYSFAPDYFTSQFPTSFGNPNYNNETLPYIVNDASIDYIYSDGLNSKPGRASESGIVNKALSVMLRFANANSVIGRNIVEYCKAHGLSLPKEYVPHVCFGATHEQVMVNDVISTAETTEGQIGEFRGIAQARGKSGNFHFDATEDGYYICLSVVVPNVGYFQGASAHTLATSKFDVVYFNEFDSVG